jgi:type I restriction enzyme S subunit
MGEARSLSMTDVMAEFYDGPHATPAPAEDGPIYLGIRNITDGGRLDLSDVRHISERDFEKWTKRVTPRPGDIVFTYEATLHRYALIPEGFRGCLGRRLALIRPDTAMVDPSFLHMYMLGPKWRAVVEDRIISGSTVDRIPIIDFPKFPIELPPLAIQRRVGAILSAFDELIEINQRRIELLEDLARSLYREWFVRFRFPGHEGIKLSESELGPLPESWQLCDLGSAARWFSGGTPSTKNDEYWDGDIPWITSGSLTSTLLDSSERRLTPAGLAAGSRLVERDSLLFVVRGMSLVREFRVGIADRPLAFGQDCKALVAADGVDPMFLAFTVLDRQSKIQGMVELAGHGTGKLSTDRVKSVKFALPPPSLQSAFASMVRPVRELMSTLTLETRRFMSSRDMLLPRLVTGQIDVSDVDLGQLLPTEAA